MAPYLIAVAPVGCVFYVGFSFLSLGKRTREENKKGKKTFRLTLSLSLPLFSHTQTNARNSANAQPQGVNVAPNGIVVGPVGKAYTPQVRRERERSFFSFSFFLFFSSFLLRRARASEKRRRRLTRSLFSPQIEIISLFFFPSPQGAVYAPVNNAYAPVRIDLTPPKPGDDTGDASGFNDNNGSKKRRAASRKLMGSPGASDDKEEEVVVKEGRAPHVDPFGGHLGGKLTISDDPLVWILFLLFVDFLSIFSPLGLFPPFFRRRRGKKSMKKKN